MVERKENKSRWLKEKEEKSESKYNRKQDNMKAMATGKKRKGEEIREKTNEK